MHVSIITPARNASSTLERTIESLWAQTHTDWELLIVDNGSTDDTREVADRCAARDVRIRVFSEPEAGVSRARNRGLREAWFEWVLFLDADDTLSPNALELLADVLRQDPKLDAVHGGWDRRGPNGESVAVKSWPIKGDIFSTLTMTCVFPIHACVLRRRRILEAGGFSNELTTCEDWDLWQRTARAGVRFGYVSNVVAHYHMRRGSASNAGRQLARDGVIVIRRGHAPDPRVRKPRRRWKHGEAPGKLPAALSYMLSWCAGLLIGSGEDADELLEHMQGVRFPEFDPALFPELILPSVLLPECRHPGEWAEIWPNIEPRLRRYAEALERHNGNSGFAVKTMAAMRRYIASEMQLDDGPIVLDDCAFVRVETTEHLADIELPSHVTRVECRVTCNGKDLTHFELPVFHGRASARVLADAIASRCADDLLEHFFKRHHYPQLRICRDGDHFSIWHGSACLEPMFRPDPDWFWLSLHKQMAWLCLLQDLWSAPSATGEALRDGTLPEDHKAPERPSEDYRAVVELTDPVTLTSPLRELLVLVTVGGSALCHFTARVVDGRVGWGEIRRQVIRRTGSELRDLVVREALLGRSLDDEPSSLRERLALRCDDSRKTLSRFARHWFLEGKTNGAPGPRGSFIPRRSRERNPRSALLPADARPHFEEIAALTGEPLVEESANPRLEAILYLPEIQPASREHQDGEASDRKRAAFNRLFREEPDPWNYATAYERTKYEQTLDLLPSGAVFENVLELACAEGFFTHRLAARARRVRATDFSSIALKRAQRRCAHLDNVEFRELDFVKDPIDGEWDLVVCSETLYDVESPETLGLLLVKLAGAVRPGGFLLTTHSEIASDSEDGVGFEWGVAFGASTIDRTLREATSFELQSETRVPLYRAQLWRRPKEGPEKVDSPRRRVSSRQPTRLPPDVREHAKLPENALPPESGASQWRTMTLPILMYHRVAPTGSDAMRQWRVTPESFEEQLATLKRLGFFSVTFHEWSTSVTQRRPLPGKPIILTFDDGYLDFYEYAWPLLRKYDMGATMYLVTDRIGGTNAWDAEYGEEVPLMSWHHIHELQVHGIEFGSHTAAHPFLTTLSPARQVDELARSRAVLLRELGRCDSFAYPYGDNDEITQHLAGACGYNFAVTCDNRAALAEDRALALPRIEVRGDETLKHFRNRLVPPIHVRGLRKLEGSPPHLWARERVPPHLYENAKRWYRTRFG